jgi:hypothetical protein
MNCSSPISWDQLVAYWACDLPAAEVDRIDEHLMGCDACSSESARVFAVADAAHSLVPFIVSRSRLEQLGAQGLRIRENTFLPGHRPVVFPGDVDLLVHRLSGFDLSNAKRVYVTVRVESTGEVLGEVPDAPFDVNEGVLIACQRHFESLPPDTLFEVRAIEASGAERTAVYSIPHSF